MAEGEVFNEVVIVGAGISGLATALALHRKGIKSVVLERSEGLRVAGAAIGIRKNGWRALEQIGVANTLRQTALLIQRERDIMLNESKQRERPMAGEARCLKRSDIISVLYDALPPGTIHLECKVVSVSLDPQTSYPILHLLDGSSIATKVLIGCDGSNSVIGEFLQLKPTKVFSLYGVRGLTNYPDGHSFGQEFLRVRKDKILVGRIPIDNKLVYWFAAHTPTDSKIWQDPQLIRQSTLDSLNGFPQEIEEMIKNTNLDSLSLTHLRYRAPWDLLMPRFHKGTVTVAGDAMHVMGPFLGQGGSAGLEDAVVLARSLAPTLTYANSVRKINEALDQYVKQRRMRVVRLSTQTYLTGLLLETSSLLIKCLCIFFMVILFYNPSGHTNYDCGFL